MNSDARGPRAAGRQLRISLVIPAFNEEDYLPALLDSVDEARARYAGDGAAIEVVVADNASTDRTAALALERGCRVVSEPRRRIASARNAGARAAQGEILAFVDADSRLHPQTFNAIETTLDEHTVVGATGIEMSRSSAGIAVTVAVLQPIARLLRIDSGVVFCRRRDWQAVGGYNEQRRYAEDVEFLRDLKRLGRRRRQRFARARGARTITSARKFDRYGDWHYFTILARATVLLVKGRAFDRFADEYWYQGR
jgi:glycosyltransferase involved in cell wall biosynthesis